MKKNSKDLLKVPLEKLEELFAEQALCIACKCVSAADDIDHLHVFMVAKASSRDYDPISISCGKCRESLFASFPFVEKAADAGQFVPFLKASVVPAIGEYTKSFLKRGLDPQEHITVKVAKVPANFDAEKDAAEFQRELDEMKRWPLW